MRFLLDSHVFLWLNDGSSQIEESVLRALSDPANDRIVSLASYWELSIKASAGKLRLPEPPATYIPSRMALIAAELLQIDPAHVFLATSLPRIHRDPFDRILVAQSRIEGIPLVTRDRSLAEYGIDLILA